VVASLRLSRRARNNLRLYGLSVGDVVAVLEDPIRTTRDHTGNPRFDGRVGDKVVRVAIARDDPTRVITAFERRR